MMGVNTGNMYSCLQKCNKLNKSHLVGQLLNWTYRLHVPIVLKCGSLKLLEPLRSVQACNGIALPFTFTCIGYGTGHHVSLRRISAAMALWQCRVLQATSLPQLDLSCVVCSMSSLCWKCSVNVAFWNMQIYGLTRLLLHERGYLLSL